MTDPLLVGEHRQERKARSEQARSAEIQQPKTDAVVPEEDKQSAQTTMPTHNFHSTKLLDGEKTKTQEDIGSGLPWGNVEIINVSIVRRSMG